MNRRGILFIVLAIFVCCSSSYANLTNVTYADDGDGAFVCTPWSWSGNASDLAVGVYGDAYWAPGHVLFNVDTTGPEDPTLKISNSIENDSTFAWTKFTVNIYMATNFSLSNVTVTNPASWSVVSYDASSTWNGSQYVATVVYNTGPAIPNDYVSTIDFGYWVQYAASPFSFLAAWLRSGPNRPAPWPSSG